MSRVTVGKAREAFADLLNQVAYRKNRIVLHRRGKDVAVLVPMEDLSLLRDLEDRLDLEAAREALKEPGSVPWTTVKERLGLATSKTSRSQ